MKWKKLMARLVSSWSHPARGAWIEINPSSPSSFAIRSHPARGAWIEMFISSGFPFCPPVAPRKGCVD